MSLSLKELSNLLGFLQEDEIGNQTFDSYSSAFQKAGFSKQVKIDNKFSLIFVSNTIPNYY